MNKFYTYEKLEEKVKFAYVTTSCELTFKKSNNALKEAIYRSK